jgi:hypothetical protein
MTESARLSDAVGMGQERVLRAAFPGQAAALRHRHARRALLLPAFVVRVVAAGAPVLSRAGA